MTEKHFIVDEEGNPKKIKKQPPKKFMIVNEEGNPKKIKKQPPKKFMYKTGGLVIKGKPKLTRKGWK